MEPDQSRKKILSGDADVQGSRMSGPDGKESGQKKKSPWKAVNAKVSAMQMMTRWKDEWKKSINRAIFQPRPMAAPTRFHAVDINDLGQGFKLVMDVALSEADPVSFKLSAQDRMTVRPYFGSGILKDEVGRVIAVVEDGENAESTIYHFHCIHEFTFLNSHRLQCSFT